MKKNWLPLFILLFIFNGCKTTKPEADIRADISEKQVVAPDVAPPVIDFHDQSTWLLGYFNPELLTHYPYSTWYLEGFDNYKVKPEVLSKLQEINKEEISIKIVMGIWCPDSRREVPRFMKILDEWKFPASKVIFIGVDDAKQSPVGEYLKLDIQRVPTFIIYKNNIEAGRIIENPTTSLEQDMVNILTGMNNNE